MVLNNFQNQIALVVDIKSWIQLKYRIKSPDIGNFVLLCY